MLPFHKVYFDSNLAIKEGWPKVSAQFKRTLRLAKILQTTVILLDVVERELEAHWVRQYDELQGAVANLHKLHGQVGLTTTPGLDAAEVKAAYRKSIDQMVSEHGLVRMQCELRPTMEFFEMAISESKPFQKKGRNFQDAVICLAAIDELAKDPTHIGVFLTKDSNFDQKMLDALCGPRKVRLLLFPDLNQLSETFISELDERFKKTWDEDQKEAAKVVGENLSLISAYLAKNLEIPATLGFGGDILSVEQIEDITVSSVRTPFPLEREDGKPFILTAELEVSLRAIVRGPSIPWFLSQPPTVRVGSAVLNPYLPPLKQTTNEPTEQIIKRTVQVEIRATEKDGQYSNLEPVSVSLK